MLNSGLLWLRRRFLRKPGKVVVEILDPIAPGMEKEAFFAKLQGEIEGASGRLMEEGANNSGFSSQHLLGD